MRLFVAVELEPIAAAKLGDVVAEMQQRLASRAPDARLTWVPPERLHLTVRFLGEMDDLRAASVAQALRPPLPVAAFPITFGDLGVFPTRGPLRVIWIGIDHGALGLRALAAEVQARLTAVGIAGEDREYAPHLTIARVRFPGGLRAATVLEPLKVSVRSTTRVDAITLFQSRLSSKGPTYLPLQRTALEWFE